MFAHWSVSDFESSLVSDIVESYLIVESLIEAKKGNND